MIGGRDVLVENKFVPIKPGEPYIQKAIPIQHVPAEVVPAHIETSLTREQLAQMEASIVTILNLNRLPVDSKMDAMFEKLFEYMPIESIKENINFLASYGIIPPLAEMSGGATPKAPKKTKEKRPIITEPARKSGRTSTPTAVKIASIEYIKYAEETARLAKEQRFVQKQQAILDEQRQAETADWHAKNPSGFIPSNFTPDTLPQIYFEAVSKIHENHSASALFEAIMPPIVVSRWKDELKKNCRKAYEPSNPATQCNNTIGAFTDQPCYICGFPITPEEPEPSFFYSTCEHILPIIQAVFFLDLYRGSDKNLLSPEQLSVLQLEYAWAHQSCNMVKSDDSYLCTVLDGKFPTWVYNRNNIRQILTNIYNTDSYNPGSDKVQYNIRAYQSKTEPFKKGYEGWLDDRTTSIVDTKMKPIQAYLNRKNQPGLLMMIGLGNLMNKSKWTELFSEKYREFMSAPTSGEETIRTASPFQLSQPLRLPAPIPNPPDEEMSDDTYAELKMNPTKRKRIGGRKTYRKNKKTRSRKNRKNTIKNRKNK